MKKTMLIVLVCALSACACKCRYNEYLPENNRLAIPDELKPVKSAPAAAQVPAVQVQAEAVRE
ncbi:MAG: hypothetical protein LBL52_04350 [Rickettsiales bacterium]|jgi:hypothetical protein|nr:hypothetical protein [Rickettsiales bacterium]